MFLPTELFLNLINRPYPSQISTVIRAGLLLNRQNYKSNEQFENLNPDLIEFLKNIRRSDGIRVLVIRSAGVRISVGMIFFIFLDS